MDIYDLYETLVARYASLKAGQVVVDVGGGKSCPFAKRIDPAARARIVGVDISEEELKHNANVDEKRIADITRGLPFEPGEADLVVSRSVLEHLEDLEAFVAGSKPALKKGGHFIHVFPCKFAPFALINQALPDALSRRLLYFFVLEGRGIVGFPAFYDDCYYSGISKVLEKHGFEKVDVYLSYYQSWYFDFFVPLYLATPYTRCWSGHSGRRTYAPTCWSSPAKTRPFYGGGLEAP